MLSSRATIGRRKTRFVRRRNDKRKQEELKKGPEIVNKHTIPLLLCLASFTFCPHSITKWMDGCRGQPVCTHLTMNRRCCVSKSVIYSLVCRKEICLVVLCEREQPMCNREEEDADCETQIITRESRRGRKSEGWMDGGSDGI